MTYKCFVCKKEYKRYGWYRKHMVREYKISALFLYIIFPAIEMNDKRTLRVISENKEALKAWLMSDKLIGDLNG